MFIHFYILNIFLKTRIFFTDSMRPLSIREPSPRPGSTGGLPPALRVGIVVNWP